MPFAGFTDGKMRLTRLPAQFFSDLLPEIDTLAELKVTLYALWFLERMEGKVRFLTYKDFTDEARLLKDLGEEGLKDALERAVQRGTFLRVTVKDAGEEALYFLNSPRGRAAVQAIHRGEWNPLEGERAGVSLEVERPNIFRLYEQNIGPLTPLIGEVLQEAEQTYPQAWIEEAFKIAVEKNVRRWKYIEAILKSWQEEGRDETNRRDSAKDRRRYVEGEFADFIEH
ncbi:MAG TPA: DnaD domain protein [Anaerolinea thermolimosa]|uniref:DNA replication protein DnaD n=1 Tax=Anaerolinea thermolimosa TaxID=229919 RepID=A0A3D1JID0_9CHLR|nr:DnaD domain protein [Anaerolinea thermolimosa]GAP08434.1 DNA replication protein DnaD [Anaerolinea thermolimosa]HCE17376.1 DnaD domain protein [Anaerolinea thermolimosa]